MRMKQLLATLAVVALALPALADAAPKNGGVLKVGIAARTVTTGVDPDVIQGESTGWVLGQIAEGLLNYDQSMNLVPWLANSWTISDDGLTYTFVLREGLMFQNGREMTADDVKFSFKRILDPKTGSRRRQNLDMIDHIDVLDSRTVAIHLKSRFAPFLSNLVGVWAPIIPKESVNPDGSITHPIGTGPFRFVEWMQNEHLTLKKFDGYWRKTEPHLDGVTFLPLSDDAARVTALRTGAVDMITSVPAQLLPVLVPNKNRGFQLLVAPGTSWNMAIMNNQKPPFNDVRVRQAVNVAIDREGIMLARTFGYGTVDNQIWDQGSFWRMAGEVPKTDPAKAKALLAAAGYKNGLAITIECKSAYLNDAEVVQSQLNAAGFKAKIKILDWVALKKRMLASDYQMVISAAGWYADLDSRYGRFYVKSGPANYFAGGYDNPKVADLIAQGRTETVPAKRKVIYQQVIDILQHDVPHVMLYFAPQTMAWRNDVMDFRTDRQGDLAYGDGGLSRVWLNR